MTAFKICHSLFGTSQVYGRTFLIFWDNKKEPNPCRGCTLCCGGIQETSSIATRDIIHCFWRVQPLINVGVWKQFWRWSLAEGMCTVIGILLAHAVIVTPLPKQIGWSHKDFGKLSGLSSLTWKTGTTGMVIIWLIWRLITQELSVSHGIDWAHIPKKGMEISGQECSCRQNHYLWGGQLNA